MVNVGGALEEDLEGPPVTNELKDSWKRFGSSSKLIDTNRSVRPDTADRSTSSVCYETMPLINDWIKVTDL